MKLLTIALLVALAVVAAEGSMPKGYCGKGGSYCPKGLACVPCGKYRCCRPRPPLCRYYGQVCGKGRVCVGRKGKLRCVIGWTLGQCRRSCKGKGSWYRCVKCRKGYCCRPKKIRCRYWGQICGKGKVCVGYKKGFRCRRGWTKGQCVKRCSRKGPWYNCVRCKKGYCCRPKKIRCRYFGQVCGKGKVCLFYKKKGLKCRRGWNKSQCLKRCSRKGPWYNCVRCKKGYCCRPKIIRCRYWGQICGKGKVCVGYKKGFRCVKGWDKRSCQKRCRNKKRYCARCKKGYCCVKKISYGQCKKTCKYSYGKCVGCYKGYCCRRCKGKFCKG